MEDGRGLDVTVVDLSPTGALLRCREPLTLGVGAELAMPGAAVKCRISRNRGGDKNLVALVAPEIPAARAA